MANSLSASVAASLSIFAERRKKDRNAKPKISLKGRCRDMMPATNSPN
jgi:hypothetical protein